MPGLGRTQQVLIMIVFWALMLIVIDLRFNHHPERTTGVGSATKPQIIFGMNHLCCTGCFESVFKAVKQQSWLTNPTLYKHDPLASDTAKPSMQGMQGMQPMQDMSSQAMQTPQSAPPAQTQQEPLQTQQEAQTVKPHDKSTYYGEVLADMDAGQANVIDLMKIYRDIEVEGFALESFRLVNVPHFNLHIILPHLCCPTCTSAVGRICDRTTKNPLLADLTEIPALKNGNVNLDGVTLEFKSDTPASETDLAQVLRVLRKIGYVPKEMRIEVLK